MRSIPFERLARWGIGAVVLLLAHGLAAPRTARATCTHLVTSQAERRADINQLDGLVTGQDARPGQPSGPRVPSPCSGPGCSNRVPLPVPPAASAPGGPDQWLALSAALQFAEIAPDRLSPDEPAPRPSAHRPSIFHPPPI